MNVPGLIIVTGIEVDAIRDQPDDSDGPGGRCSGCRQVPVGLEEDQSRVVYCSFELFKRRADTNLCSGAVGISTVRIRSVGRPLNWVSSSRVVVA